MSRPLFILLLGALAATAALSAPPQPALRTREGPLLPRAEFLHAVAASHQSLVSDYYWIRTINQIGSAQTAEAYRDVYPLANLTTDLDPKFATIYAFAAAAIPFDQGRQVYANTEESTQLLEKGLKHVPDSFRIRFLYAHNLMFFHRRYQDAARELQFLASQPGAPAYLSGLATRLYAQAGDFETSLTMATALRDTAPDEETRAFFEERILQIHQERMLQQVDHAIETFRKREGRPPRDVAELVSRRDLPGYPQDPLGGEIDIDAKGRARSTASKHRLELIEDEKLK